MKKLSLTIVLIFIVLLSFGQKDSSATPILDKTEHLVDKYSSKIADVFISAMDKATPVAKEGFKALVWLQIADGIAHLIPLFLFFLFWYLTNKEYTRIETIINSDKVPDHMNANYGIFSDDNITAKLICYLIIAIILAIMSLFSTYTGIMHLIAPKWYAIKEVINLVK